MPFLSPAELHAGLPHVLESPADHGSLELIVARPADGQRSTPEAAELDLVAGLVGDNWLARGSKHTPDGNADPQRQITVINSRLAALVADGRDAMQLAGDQLYVDFDISVQNLPAGSLLAIGGAVIEVTEPPHLGCAKFVARFGAEAMRFVNSREGRKLRLRGLNARVVVPGPIRVGDVVRKVSVSVPGQFQEGQWNTSPNSLASSSSEPSDRAAQLRRK
jgi:MOSC domain-containing protein YiiM